MPKRRIHSLLFAFVVWLVCCSGIHLEAALTEQEMAKIDPFLSHEVEFNGAAKVYITLQPSLKQQQQHQRVGGDRRRLSRREIANLQQNVLEQIPNDYESTFEFSVIPSLAGIVHSLHCLEVLAQQVNVAQIVLDRGGGQGNVGQSVSFIGANTRHAMGNAGEGVVVAFLDSGVDTDHSAFRDRLLAQACRAEKCPNGPEGPGSAEDDAGHGTHVAGIVAANGTIGGVGVAPGVQFVSVRVSVGPSFASTFDSFSRILAGLEYLIDHPELGVRVINISLGTRNLYNEICDNSETYLSDAFDLIEILRQRGVITVASTGNDASTSAMSAPACLSNVIAVGNSDYNDLYFATSNSNQFTDIFAPGVSIVSTFLGNSVAQATGSSFSAAHVTGCAALLLQSGEANTPDEIKSRLLQSEFTVTVPSTGLVFPRLDCSAQPTPRPQPTPTPTPTPKEPTLASKKSKSSKSSKKNAKNGNEGKAGKKQKGNTKQVKNSK